jgi:hypothetical protein
LFTTDSKGNSTEWIHPKMFQYFNLSKNDSEFRMGHAGRVGFNLRNEKAKGILSAWADCAMKRECIAPEGSDIYNHRQDQAALTILMYMNDIFYTNEHNTSFVNHNILPGNMKQLEQSLKNNKTAVN